MVRTKLEVADILRRHGEAWRTANAGHLNLAQRRVMTAIEICRTAALGGHVQRCQDCAHTLIAYNSCRNRHCPKCQWKSAAAWLAAREAELLPVPYFHFVFALPAAIGAMAYQNKAKEVRRIVCLAVAVRESVPGPKLTYKRQRSMSAHRGEADVTRTSLDVR
jgi:Transposase zinc-binding domain